MEVQTAPKKLTRLMSRMRKIKMLRLLPRKPKDKLLLRPLES